MNSVKLLTRIAVLFEGFVVVRSLPVLGNHVHHKLVLRYHRYCHCYRHLQIHRVQGVSLLHRCNKRFFTFLFRSHF